MMIISDKINPDFLPFFKKNLKMIHTTNIKITVIDNGKKISCNGTS
tara:strand:+ start:708 stop:845 length:138 start_codon:yes stop_codon:yes gene_type:complete